MKFSPQLSVQGGSIMLRRWIILERENTCADADKAKVVTRSKFVLRRGENSFFENSGDGDEGLPPLISGAAAKQTFRPRFRVRTDGIRGMRFVIIVVVVVVVRQTRTAQSIERNRGKFVLSNSSLVLPSSESPAADQPSSVLLTLPHFGAPGLTQS